MEIKQASEKAVHLWVGAMSPMWVPFWAATSFGIGAWTVVQSLSRSGGLFKDLPQVTDLASKWPGFNVPLPKDLAEPAEAPAETAAERVKSTIDSQQAVATKVADTVVETRETVVETAKPAFEILIDPVTEIPVIPGLAEATAEFTPVDAPVPASVVDAAAEVVKAAEPAPVIQAAKPVAKAMPKPIAAELAVAKPAVDTKPESVATKPAPAPAPKPVPPAKPAEAVAPKPADVITKPEAFTPAPKAAGKPAPKPATKPES
ncbi:hypothetical protein ABAC402_16920 [Asticcacaulis sp. AC402]|nr:hypothetical protein ABAC402_16920 [Asticcacaulis sp. AC402]